MKSNTVWEDVKKNLPSYGNYVKISPDIREIHYWNLPDHLTVDISNFKLRTPSLSVHKPTIKTIKRIIGNNSKLEKKIQKVVNWTLKRFEIHIKLPLKLKNRHYVSLYSLMLSEGDYKNEFRLQVPEKELHQIFVNSLKNLFPRNNFSELYSLNNTSIPRSTASSIFRYFIPIPEIIPKFILLNKNFSKIYLRIAFESEGSVLPDGAIQLSRSIKLPQRLEMKGGVGKKFFIGRLKKEYPKLYFKLIKYFPVTLLGEYLMLKHNFDIESKLIPESVRINKTNIRRGKYSIKWKLRITSVNKNKFIREIGFITKIKKSKALKVLDLPTRNPKLFSLEVMKKISKDNIFTRKKFVEKMKKLYKNPQSFIENYERIGLIKRVERGKYKITNPYQSKQHLLH